MSQMTAQLTANASNRRSHTGRKPSMDENPQQQQSQQQQHRRRSSASSQALKQPLTSSPGLPVTELLVQTPAPILHFASRASPVVSTTLFFSRLVSWTHPNPFASWSLLAGWIVLCLGGHILIRYALPLLLLILISISRLSTTNMKNKKKKKESRRHSRVKFANISLQDDNDNNDKIDDNSTNTQAQLTKFTPVDYSTFITETSDLAVLLSDFNKYWDKLFQVLTWKDPASTKAFLRFLVTSYPFYVAIFYFVPPKYIICTVGSVLLTWNASWARIIRTLLWKSALVRVIVRSLLGILGGLQNVRQEWRRGSSIFQALIRLLKQGAAIQNKPPVTTSHRSPLHYHARSYSSTNKTVNVTPSDNNNNNNNNNNDSFPKEKDVTASSSITPPMQASLHSDNKRGEDIYFLFTVFENQRWWVGLDWTQALLPNERTSWSDGSDAPVSSPSSFVLPRPVITYTRSPTRKDPDAHIKRTFEWRWIDPEWRVRPAYHNKPNVGSPTASNRRLTVSSISSVSTSGKATPPSSPTWPSFKQLSPNTTTPRKKQNPSLLSADSASTSNTIPTPKSPTADDSKTTSLENNKSFPTEENERQANDVQVPPTPTITNDIADDDEKEDEEEDQEWDVDAEGWQYGDNMWEKMSSKGGMGRYTRRRAWIRRAIVVEILENVSGEEARLLQEQSETEQYQRKYREEQQEVDSVKSTSPSSPTSTLNDNMRKRK